MFVVRLSKDGAIWRCSCTYVKRPCAGPDEGIVRPSAHDRSRVPRNNGIALRPIAPHGQHKRQLHISGEFIGRRQITCFAAVVPGRSGAISPEEVE